MKKPASWNAIMAADQPWELAYPEVAAAVRAFLMNEPEGERFTTDEMVEELYPERFAKGAAGIEARRRIYRALAALATKQLADCASRGPPRKLKHKNLMVMPWIWSRPVANASQQPAITAAPDMTATEVKERETAMVPPPSPALLEKMIEAGAAPAAFQVGDKVMTPKGPGVVSYLLPGLAIVRVKIGMREGNFRLRELHPMAG